MTDLLEMLLLSLALMCMVGAVAVIGAPGWAVVAALLVSVGVVVGVARRV